MTEPYTHCQCDNCSGRDCGQDNPDRYLKQQIQDEEKHDAQIREKVLNEVWERFYKEMVIQTPHVQCDPENTYIPSLECGEISDILKSLRGTP